MRHRIILAGTIIAGGIIALAIMLVRLGLQSAAPTPTPALSPSPTPTPAVSLQPSPSSSVRLKVGDVSLAVLVADTPALRLLGLSDRESLDPYDGMLFLFPESGKYGFVMRRMQFPLDFIWIANDTVVGITPDVPAPAEGTTESELQIYYPPVPVDRVLEVVAGAASQWGIAVGDEVILEYQQ